MTTKSIIYTTEVNYDPTDLDVEDSGQAQIYSVVDLNDDEEDGMFIKIQSWSKSGKHPDMDRLKGKRIRVTVEVLD